MVSNKGVYKGQYKMVSNKTLYKGQYKKAPIKVYITSI